MNRKNRTISALMLALTMLIGLCACSRGTTGIEQPTDAKKHYPDAHILTLSGETASLDGAEVERFDYTWHCDPSVSHDEVKNAPAEYYTGTKPETDAAAYIDHELFYYPMLPESGFRRVNYDGETEWAYYYTDGVNDAYIFATLPDLGASLPTQMMHTEEEAAQDQVLHITQPGNYLLQGRWKGQIRVELGDADETFTDANAKVTLILDGADITCAVAPGVVFASAYECDNTWEAQESWSADVDLENAGVRVIVADGSENTVTGANVFRMLKTKYKDEDSTDPVKVQKKMRKLDAAFYSYVSMRLEGGEAGTGSLTVTSSFEGVDSELHLAVNGGRLHIRSQDDGMNVNEDHVSVIQFNGGDVTIEAALGAEGDGVDSNGFIVLNGGTLQIDGIRVPDSALDSEDGIYYYGGTVILDGQEQSYEAGSVFRETGGMGGPGEQGGFRPDGQNDPFSRGEPIDPLGQFSADFDLKSFKEKVAALPEDAALADVLALLGWNAAGGQMMPGFMQPGQMPAQPNGQQMPGGPQGR